MDSDPLRHLEFFSMPNNQTINPLDQSLLSEASSQPPAIWNPAALSIDTGFAPTSLSLDTMSQPSPLTGLSSMSPNMPSPSHSSVHSGQSRPVLPARGPRTKENRDRKRSRLSMDATPFDSVDYWIEFDKDEALSSIPEGVESNFSGKGKAPMTRRPAKPAAAPPASASKGTGLRMDEFVDDSALDNALSDDEDDDDKFSNINLADHLSKIESAPPPDVPPREGLYSTPLSWERPQPGLRMDSLIGLNNSALNEAEQRRLIAIAMNPGPSMGGLGSNINFNFSEMGSGLDTALGAGFGSLGQGPKPVSPPQFSAGQPPRPTPPDQAKRQGSVGEKGGAKPKSGDRTAHNDIERKYRTNLKDRIAELRDAVPALRTIPENGEEDSSQPSRTPKVSKGAVLTKATEYIHWLERRNKLIVQQHRELSRRLQAFEQLLNATAQSAYAMPSYSRTLFDPRGFC